MSKYFSFLYKNKTEKFIKMCLSKGKFIINNSPSYDIYKILKSSNKIYILLANIESKIVNGIIKQIEFKNGQMKFEIKSKCEITFNEINESQEVTENDFSIFEINNYTFYLPNLDVKVNELYGKDEETFETIRDLIKEKYKKQKLNENNNENIKKNDGNDTFNNVMNNPFLYHMLNYQQMCVAIQK